MKRSLRLYLTLSYIALLACILLLCGIANNLFLEMYYRGQKEKSLVAAYELLQQGFSSGAPVDLSFLSARYDLGIIVLDPSSATVSLSGSEESLKRRLLDILFAGSTGAPMQRDILESNEHYALWIAKDGRTGTDYMEIWGTLLSGETFLMQSPLESMRESAAVANRFLLYIGLFGMIAGGLLVWILSGPLEKTLISLQAKNEALQLDLARQKKLDEMRNEFIANASHELKTPLAIIQGYAEGLTDGACEDEEMCREYAGIIADEAAKMDWLVKSLLTLNELEQGEEYHEERFDLAALIRDYLNSVQVLIREAQAEVIFDTAENDEVMVLGDPDKLGQVFANYFTNALHHLSGERKIRIGLRSEGKQAVVSVFNTGEPIPEEALPHIWEKFYKADKARTRAYGGNGIGLSIVKAILDGMGGSYGVENKKNGVEFFFIIGKETGLS